VFRGPAGWASSARSRSTRTRRAHGGWRRPSKRPNTAGPRRSRTVEVNTTVPVVSPERAHELVAASGCRTATRWPTHGSWTTASGWPRCGPHWVGPSGSGRVDANAAWDVATAVRAIADLDKAAAGLDTSEQPCVSIEEAGRRTPVAAEPHHVHRQRISQAAQYSGLGADTHFVLVVLTVCGGCGQAGTDLAAGFPRLRVETPGLASGLSRMWRRSVPGQH